MSSGDAVVVQATSTCAQCGAPGRPSARFCRVCGAQLSQKPGSPDSPRVPPRRRVRKLTRRRIITRLAITAAVVIVAAVGGVYAIQKYAYSPESTVRDFFAALEEKDFERVAQLVDREFTLRSENEVGQPSRAVVNFEDLTEGYSPPTDARVLDVRYGESVEDLIETFPYLANSENDRTRRPNKNDAFVTVQYRVGETVHESGIRLSRERSGFFREWHIENGVFGALNVVSPQIPIAQVAQADFPTLSEEPPYGTDRISMYRVSQNLSVLLPGRYTVSAQNPLLDIDRTDVEVMSTQLSTATLNYRVKPSVVTEVDRQVRARLDECAEMTELSESGCPLRSSELVFPPPTDVRWTIDSYPQIEISASDRTTEADEPEAQVRTTRDGQATVTYTDSGEPQREEVTVSVNGVVTVEDGHIVWSL